MVLDDKRKSQLWEGSSEIDRGECISHSFHILFITDQVKGFVSIFQLLGWYIRRISMVFQPDLTTRDKQHGTVRLWLNRRIVYSPIYHMRFWTVFLFHVLRFFRLYDLPLISFYDHSPILRFFRFYDFPLSSFYNHSPPILRFFRFYDCTIYP